MPTVNNRGRFIWGSAVESRRLCTGDSTPVNMRVSRFLEPVQNEYRAPSCICQRLAPSSRASRSTGITL